MLSFTVWYFLDTEIPYSSSQMEITMGTCSTPAAFNVSQKMPSDVLASPMVPHAISFPPLENLVRWLSSSRFLYILDAWAKPRSLAICPAVGEISDDVFLDLV